MWRLEGEVIVGWGEATDTAPLQRHGAALHGGGQPAVRYRGGGGVPGATRARDLRHGVRGDVQQGPHLITSAN